MPESDEFWALFWEVRLQELQDQGKKEAILVVSKLIREQAQRAGRSVRLLELGCGEGQIIGSLVEGHAQVPSIHDSIGVDLRAMALEKCRSKFPKMQFIEGDFTDTRLLTALGRFEIVLLVNALHEVFSAEYLQEAGEIDVIAGKRQVEKTLALAADCVVPGGYLVIFDGLEPYGDPHETLRVRFLDRKALDNFETFAREYYPFRISYRIVDDFYRVELSRRDFTRYITKLIFLGKRLWETERLESYQYFTETEFRAAIHPLGLKICELRTFTVDDEKWRMAVEIESSDVDFPEEHILIVAQK